MNEKKLYKFTNMTQGRMQGNLETNYKTNWRKIHLLGFKYLIQNFWKSRDTKLWIYILSRPIKRRLYQSLGKAAVYTIYNVVVSVFKSSTFNSITK